MRTLIALCLLLAAAIAQAETVLIDKAEFVMSDSPTPPGDDAPWQPVSLPDDWHQSRPGTSGIGWYRMQLPEIAEKRFGRAVILARNSTYDIALFINRTPFGGQQQRMGSRTRGFQFPASWSLPTVLLNRPQNVLYLRVQAVADLRQGLTRVAFGDGASAQSMFQWRSRIQPQLYLGGSVAGLLAGIAALLFWRRRRDDPVLGWFGLAALLAGVPALFGLFLPGGLPPDWPREAIANLNRFAYAPALFTGLLRLAGRPIPWLERSLWAVVAAAFSAPLLGLEGSLPLASMASGPLQFLFALALAGAIVFTLYSAKLRGAMLVAGTAAALAAIGMQVHDYAGWMGWVDYDAPSFSQYMPLMVLAVLGGLGFRRHIDAVVAVERHSLELESRVAARTAEIEHSYARVKDLEHEQATMRERQRILADLHDGLGASLVSLLSVVQAGRIGLKEVEPRVHDALQELRLAVDSLDTPEGDLLTALGTVRHRMRDAIEAAGVELAWDVQDVPRLESLTPTRILHLQRIVLEALNNAMRHAGAKHITVATRLDPALREIELSVTDDGRGGATDAFSGGKGLANMRRRATMLGGDLSIDSPPGGGTRVALRLSVGSSEGFAPEPVLAGQGRRECTDTGT